MWRELDPTIEQAIVQMGLTQRWQVSGLPIPSVATRDEQWYPVVKY